MPSTPVSFTLLAKLSKGFATDTPVTTQSVFGGGAQGASGTTSEVFDYIDHEVVGFTIRRGRSSEFESFQTGTMTLTLNNRQRQFDPHNTSSPYNGSLLPMRHLYLWINGDPVFDGYVESWPTAYDTAMPGDVTVSCVDGMAALAMVDITRGGSVYDSAAYNSAVYAASGQTTFPVEKPGARLNRVLSLGRWPTDYRDIDTGVSELSTTAPTGTLLPYVQEVEKADDGFAFVAANGYFVYRDRHARYRNTRMTTSQATFADDGSGIPYSHIEGSFAVQHILNDVRRTAEGGTEQQAFDTASADLYGRRTSSETLIAIHDRDARDLAHVYLHRHKNPQRRIESIRVNLSTSGPTHLNTVLKLQLLDRVTVKHTPGSTGSQIVSEHHVEGIELRAADKTLTAELWLSPATSDPFTLYDSATAKFDESFYGA